MRQVFFSFHYMRDVWRASMVRNMGKVDKSSTFSDNDWEEVRYKGSADHIFINELGGTIPMITPASIAEAQN